MSNYTYAPTLSQQMPTMSPFTFSPTPRKPNPDDARVALELYKTAYERYWDMAEDFYWGYPTTAMILGVTACAITLPRVAYWAGKKIGNPDQEKNPVAYNLLETCKNISDASYYGVQTVVYGTASAFGFIAADTLMESRSEQLNMLGQDAAPAVFLTMAGTLSAGYNFTKSTVKTCYYGLKTTGYTVKTAIEDTAAVIKGAATLANTTANTFVGLMHAYTKKKEAESSRVKEHTRKYPKAVPA